MVGFLMALLEFDSFIQLRLGTVKQESLVLCRILDVIGAESLLLLQMLL